MKEETSTRKIASRWLIQRIAPLIALALVAGASAGCSVASDLSSRLHFGQRSSSPSATSAATSSTDSASAAIQALIQRANQEQQEAFSKRDPSLMKDTATADYYDQMVQTNIDLYTGGVSSIELVKIEWGPISVTGTTAKATDFETWRTTYVDGSTDQIRERNIYTLVQEQGVWKIQNDEHPDANPGQPAPPGSTI